MVFGRPIFFDADGTLTDSLAPHVQFCRDLNDKLSLGLNLPNPHDLEACRKIAGTPMSNFLLNAGFPKDQIPELINIYKQTFSKNPDYATHCFPGIPEMIAELHKRDRTFGIITSNTEANVKKALGEELYKKFSYVADIEQIKRSGSKGDALNVANAWLDNIPSRAIIYVGDTESDYEASQLAETSFIGVSYGWQIRSDDKRFPVANSPKELSDMLLKS